MRGKAKSQPELVCLMSPEMAVPKNHPIRFSGKYEDVETGYNYYGFRFYNPDSGRWLNRDPSLCVPRSAWYYRKRGIINYGFIDNNAVMEVDYLGLCRIWYKCDLKSSSGSCDKTCEYECVETKRENPSVGMGTPCSQLPEPFKFTYKKHKTGWKILGKCCWAAKCDDPISGVARHGSPRMGLDCSKKECEKDCKTQHRLAKLACRGVIPTKVAACRLAAQAAYRLCKLSCDWCKNP